jgi:hypothetical protein
VIGYERYRPLGKSHFHPAPDHFDPTTPYIPAVLSKEALGKAWLKALRPLVPLSEWRYEQMLQFGFLHIVPYWQGSRVWDDDEAIAQINMRKSPGYPYCYLVNDKQAAFDSYGAEIHADCERVMSGEPVWMPFLGTLKDELRLREKVENHQTRGFSQSGIVHLKCSKRLFGDQSRLMSSHREAHASTLGISVPGPEFVQRVLSHDHYTSGRPLTWGADGSGQDQTFNLTTARVIRDLRKSRLPERFHAAADLIYNARFCGDVIVGGTVYRLLHGHSGADLTSDDNGIELWLETALYVIETVPCSALEAAQYFKYSVNGDDQLLSFIHPSLSGPGWVAFMATLGKVEELESEEPRFARECTFLSNTLRERFVRPYGDCLVAAGNLPKLLSSMEFFKSNDLTTNDEAFLLHLIGLRIGLWPYRAEFEDLEARIDAFIRQMQPLSQRMFLMLASRIPETRIQGVHFHVEGAIFRPLRLGGLNLSA